jgi:hypothetical protein
MSIQPLVGLPGVSASKLTTRREIFLHPDKVAYRNSNRFLHKNAKDWEDDVSPNTLKAGTLLALRKLRFPGDSQSKLYWFPFVLTANHLSDTNKILLPASFKKYSYMFTAPCKFTRIQMNTGESTLFYSTVTSNGSVDASGANLVINFDPGIIANSTWADRSVLVFWGTEGGPPSATASPFEYLLAFSILPGDTLVSDTTHLQLHHYPYEGIVKGDMIYPRYTLSASDPLRNIILKRILKTASSVGLCGLLVDEATYE